MVLVRIKIYVKKLVFIVITITQNDNIANLISKLNFYKLISYPMDNCFTGRFGGPCLSIG